jgi:hypothetical protein
MDNLFVGIRPSPLWKRLRIPWLSRVEWHENAPQTTRQSGSFTLESVAAFLWNGWQPWRGISGSLGVEYANSTRNEVSIGTPPDEALFGDFDAMFKSVGSSFAFVSKNPGPLHITACNRLDLLAVLRPNGILARLTFRRL